MLPDHIKSRLKRREDGRDIIGVSISIGTIKKVVKAVKSIIKRVVK